MLAAWDRRREECAAGIANAIEKDFAEVNRLYTGAPDCPAGPGSPSGLPVFGGEPVLRDDGPPFLIMPTEQVGAAAAFLNEASFDALWLASGAAISANQGGDPAFVREIFLSHHGGLVAFYGAAADADQAVLKAFWY